MPFKAPKKTVKWFEINRRMLQSRGFAFVYSVREAKESLRVSNPLYGELKANSHMEAKNSSE